MLRVVLIFFFSFSSGAAYAEGAIAYSTDGPDPIEYSYATKKSLPRIAIEEAFAACGGKCNTYRLVERGECASIAAGINGATYRSFIAVSDSSVHSPFLTPFDRAAEYALNLCRQGGDSSTCRILKTFCEPQIAYTSMPATTPAVPAPRRTGFDGPFVQTGMGTITIHHWLALVSIVGLVTMGILALRRRAPSSTQAASQQPAPTKIADTPREAKPATNLAIRETAAPPKPTLKPQTMQLKMKRSQRESLFGAPILILTARMECSPDVLENIRKYRLGKRVIYESANREKYLNNASGHLSESVNNTSVFAPPKDQVMGVGKTFYKLARAGVSAGLAALSLKITIDSLIKGVTVECKDVDELLAAEEAITAAAGNLKGYLQTFDTFGGEETLIEI